MSFKKVRLHLSSNSTNSPVSEKPPIPIKDNFITDKLSTTCASAILHGFQGPSESTVAHQLRQAGYGIVAKTNMDEFGMGSHTTTGIRGHVHNGWLEKAQSVGGSSGGSAIAVAGHFSDVSIGSDTGGSVRLPAAYCGAVGFKPSYGRISRNGLIPYANSLDTVGILARDVSRIMEIFPTLDIHDEADPTSLSNESRVRINSALVTRSYYGRPEDRHSEYQIRVYSPHSMASENDPVPQEVYQKLRRLKHGPLLHKSDAIRIGVPLEYNIKEMHFMVRAAWTRYLTMLQEKGYEIVPVSLPSTRQALAAYYIIAPAEASSNLAKYDGVRYGAARTHPDQTIDSSQSPPQKSTLYSSYRSSHFGEEVQRRILLGTYSLSASAKENYFVQAQKVRRKVQHDFNNIFRLGHPLQSLQNDSQGVDYIVCPTAPTPPPLLSELESLDPVEGYINDIFTVPASLAGLPAISLPVQYGDGMAHDPTRNIGMQIIAQYGDDRELLKFAEANQDVIFDLRGMDRHVYSRRQMA